jgi:hypothetical protein
MALTIATETDRSLGIEQFSEQVNDQLDARDLDSAVAAAEPLRALANNPKFITEKLNAELRRWRSFQSTNSYSAQTLILAGGKDWILRANTWAPASSNPEVNEWQNELYYYLRPHDHNFSFLTVGYFGSGYETTIYEYDPESITGVPGEQVPLRFLEHTSLPKGKVMLYRASRDIHSQEHPKEFSVSVNLLLATTEMNLKPQFYFDCEDSRLVNYVKNGASGQVMICRLAAHLGDGNTASLLRSLAFNHPGPRLRVEAYRAFVGLEPSDAETMWKRAAEDSHELVRRAGCEALGVLEGSGVPPIDATARVIPI